MNDYRYAPYANASGVPQDFVIVKNGVVMNNPSIPVYNLDILRMPFPGEDELNHALQIINGLEREDGLDGQILVTIQNEIKEWLQHYFPEKKK